MGYQVERRDVVKFLLREGFEEVDAGSTGHRHFKKDGTKITLSGHGPQDLTKKHVGMLIRQLVALGYTRDYIIEGLRG